MASVTFGLARSFTLSLIGLSFLSCDVSLVFLRLVSCQSHIFVESSNINVNSIK